MAPKRPEVSRGSEMVGSLSHIELELAPCPQHRFGERGRVYHLYLPLRVDDRLNLDALRAAGASGHVRRCRPAEDEVAGRVTLEPDFESVEALAEDQASRWARIGGAGFLSDAEKRELLGVGK